MFTLMRQRNFALLWLGGLISMIGNWVLLAALPFYIYQRTGSALASGGLLIAYVLPFLLFGSVAGVFVDRWDRKRTMVVANLIQAAFTLLLLLVVSNDVLWIVYVVAFMESTLATFSAPAENALLPRLVGAEDLQSANAMNALNDNLARLIGPPIGGALIGTVGLNSVVILDSASFLIAAVLIAFIAAQPEVKRATTAAIASVAETWKAFWSEWRGGLQLSRKDHMILSLFIVAAIARLGDSILSALLVPFITDIVKAGSLGFGLLLTMRGIGGLAGSLVVSQLGRRLSPILLLGFSNIIGGLLLLALFNVPMFTLALILVTLIGVIMVAGMISQSVLLQQSVPDEYRGRVFGAFGSTGALVGLLGTLLGGFAGDSVGVLPVLNVSGVLTILAGMTALVLLREGHRNPQAQNRDQEMRTAAKLD